MSSLPATSLELVTEPVPVPAAITSLLAGIDLVTGKVYALVRDRDRNREFIEFIKLFDAGCLAHTAIKLILDNHSAHISY
jgi:hypothetical protein